jgi:hypothetical protein
MDVRTARMLAKVASPSCMTERQVAIQTVKIWIDVSCWTGKVRSIVAAIGLGNQLAYDAVRRSRVLL